MPKPAALLPPLRKWCAARLDRLPTGLHGPARQMVGWPLWFAAEESPGSMKTRCRVTPGGGDPRESATENKPLGLRPK